uniref:Uncharacterized protein n=1 Tax=Anguilla anguilla TaxID=7936 RepID=A0A0E9QFD7_ANGAN
MSSCFAYYVIYISILTTIYQFTCIIYFYIQISRMGCVWGKLREGVYSKEPQPASY